MQLKKTDIAIQLPLSPKKHPACNFLRLWVGRKPTKGDTGYKKGKLEEKSKDAKLEK